MKTSIIVISVLAVGLLAAYLVFSPADQAEAANADAGKQLYTCGMHPEIISEEPGYCPICGMKLTPKKDGASGGGSVKIDPTTTQNMGLVTTPVIYSRLVKSVRAFGKVDYSEPQIYTVNLKVEGWVERLFVDYEGQQVRKGQPLLDVYSPLLVAAQQEYLIADNASRNARFAGSTGEAPMFNLLKAARDRLRNWDISDDQIERLVATGEPSRTMRIASPADGVVIAKTVAEGDHVKPGRDLYQIADLSSVWIVAFVYEQDLPFVGLGQKATVELPNLPGEKFEATISYVSPYLDPKGQVEIRLDAENPDHLLKPEMYAEITLRSELPGDRLVIPRAAVINSGAKKVVYVTPGDGTFDARIVTTGAVSDDDMVEVRSGLSAGEIVVTSGQFLLDSESRLNEAIGAPAHHGQGTSGQARGRMAGMEEETSPPSPSPVSSTEEQGYRGDRKQGELSGVYTCPMPEHYDVLQYGPGKCPQCGMDLVPVEQTDNENVYVCPMPKDAVVQNKPGDCPRCGMKLVPLKQGAEEAGARMEAESPRQESDAAVPPAEGLSGIYTCPMPEHYDVLQYGPGKCPKCGMNLVPVEQTDNYNVYVSPMKEHRVVQSTPGDCPKCGMKLVKLEWGGGHDQ